MLTFTLNNQPIVLDPSTGVQIVWKNPACNFNDFPGDVGLGIEIPVNDFNRALLGNPERFERYDGGGLHELSGFEIRYGGTLLMSGTFVIENASSESYNGWLRSDVGNIGKEHREKFISDSISFNEEKTFINKSNYNPDIDDYACPEIFNPLFFQEKGQKTEAVRQFRNPNYLKKRRVWKWYGTWIEIDTRVFLNETVETEDFTEAFLRNGLLNVNSQTIFFDVFAPDTTSKADSDSIIKDLKVAVVSPMLFLNYVIRTLFKDSKFGIRNNFLADDIDLKTLVLYHNFDITNMEYFATEAEMIIEYYEKNSPFSYSGNAGVSYEKVTRSYGYTVNNIRRWVDNFEYKNLMPKMKLKDFVMSVQNLLNVFFYFVPGGRIVDIIDRESIITGETIDIGNELVGNWEMGEKKNNTLKFVFEHDDNDLLIAERWEDISEYRDKEKEAVDSWEQLVQLASPQIDEIRFIREANAYAQYKLWLLETENEEGITVQEKFIGWQQLSIGFQHAYFNYRKKNREEEEIKTEFSTLVDQQQAGTRQKGNIRSELFAFETFSPRLLFYKKMNQGDYFTKNISLDWEKEETGLLNSRWKNWNQIWATRQEVKIQADFSLNQLDYVLRNIYKKFRGREGEFIIEELKTNFGMDTVGQTEITGYKLDYARRSYGIDDMWQLGEIVWYDEWLDMKGLEKYFPLVHPW